MLIDTHCHLYKDYYENIDEIINYISKRGICKIINNGCNLKTSNEVIELSKRYKNIFCTIGLHPQEDLSELDDIITLIKENLENKNFVGIGEIGLDYYWNKDNKKEQIKVFESQLSLAQDFGLPVIIHSRESTNDMLNILKKYKLKGIIHCFNGSVEIAKEYIKMGFKLGINGIVTFNNCKLIKVIEEVGIENIVFETDSPYLTPVPDRGKKNNPSYINNIISFVSYKLDIPVDSLARITYGNVMNIFDI